MSDQVNPLPEFVLLLDPVALIALLQKVRTKDYATIDESCPRKAYGSQFFSFGVAIRTRSQVSGAVNIIYVFLHHYGRAYFRLFLHPDQHYE